MRSDHYLHPEFGCLSPTPRLRRELRTAFFSVLFGIGIGAAAMIALNGNHNTDDAPVPRGVNAGAIAASAIMEPPDAVPSDNSLQAARVEDEVNRGQTSKPDGSSADANSKNRTNAKTTCEGNDAACLNIPLPAAKPRGMRVPAANDALAIARVPLGRSDASAGMTSPGPSASSDRAPERSTARPSQQRNAEDAAADQPDSKRLSHQKPHKTVRSHNRPQQEGPNYREDRAAYWNGRSYDSPVGELGRAPVGDRTYARDRSYGVKGFWAWSD
jgi:hypothetical protein